MIIEQLTNMAGGEHGNHSQGDVWDAPNDVAARLIKANAAKKVEDTNVITRTLRKAAQAAKILSPDPQPTPPKPRFSLLPVVSNEERRVIEKEEREFFAQFAAGNDELQSLDGKITQLQTRLARTEREIKALRHPGAATDSDWTGDVNPYRPLADLREQTISALIDEPLPAGTITLVDPGEEARKKLEPLAKEQTLLKAAIEEAKKRLPALRAKITREAQPAIDKRYGPLVQAWAKLQREIALVAVRERAMAEASRSMPQPLGELLYPFMHFCNLYGELTDQSHQSAYLVQEGKSRGFIKDKG